MELCIYDDCFPFKNHAIPCKLNIMLTRIFLGNRKQIIETFFLKYFQAERFFGRYFPSPHRELNNQQFGKASKAH
jgi:hypothetical protein